MYISIQHSNLKFYQETLLIVHNVADRLTAQKVQKAQSSSNNKSLVNQLLSPSPSFSLKQYYLNIDSDLYTVQFILQPPNLDQQKIAIINKMSYVTNALTQTTQIKPQFNKPNNWVEWN